MQYKIIKHLTCLIRNINIIIYNTGIAEVGVQFVIFLMLWAAISLTVVIEIIVYIITNVQS